MRTYSGFALRRRASFVAAQVAGLAILGDWLFYGHPVGANAAVFCAALLSAVLLRGGAAWASWRGRLVVCAVLGLIVALLRAPSPPAILLSVVGLATLAIVDRRGWTAAVSLRALDLAFFALSAVRKPFRDAAASRRWKHSRDAARRSDASGDYGRWRFVVRWVLPSALALTFIGLFALANPVIAAWMDLLPGVPAPLRIMLWASIAFATWGLLRGRSMSDLGGAASSRRGLLERIAGREWIAPALIVFNVIFAVQTILDLWYLLGGAQLPEGITYAGYAHRGAYPLLVTTLLAALFVLTTFRPGGLAESHPLTRRLVLLWIAQNVLLVGSAAWRLSLYVDAYSLTRLRVAAAIWMLLVAVGLVLLIVRIIRGFDNRWLTQATTLAAAMVLYACAFVDFGRVIADYNVAHCAECARPADPRLVLRRAELDIDYLESMGPSAIPALDRYMAALERGALAGDSVDTVTDGDDVNRRIDLADRVSTARSAHDRLRADLERNLSNWRGWTLTRASLAAAHPRF